MKNIFHTSIVLVFVCFSCNLKPSKKENIIKHRDSITKVQVADSIKNDSIVYSRIEALPESKELLKISKKTDPFSLIIWGRPGLSSPYYWVQVGLNHSERFEPVYNFYVTRKFEVFYYDTLNDTTLTLEQWRLQRRVEK
jgi:hypothetical protein